MSKTTKRSHKSDEDKEVGGGFLSGLINLIEKLGELAEKGKELQEPKEFGTDRMKGVYGFTIRTNLRGSKSGNRVKVEPFGNGDEIRAVCTSVAWAAIREAVAQLTGFSASAEVTPHVTVTAGHLRAALVEVRLAPRRAY